jgi:hypothetical protein
LTVFASPCCVLVAEVVAVGIVDVSRLGADDVDRSTL